jgi:hypothetical protein
MKNIVNKELVLEKRRAQRHNSLLRTKYTEYNIPPIDVGCCPICGTYHCENEFCKKHNFQQIIGFVKHLGLNPITIGTPNIFKEFDRIRDLVYDLYWNQGLSSLELGKKFGYKNSRMQWNVFDELNIPMKDLSTATVDALLSGRSSLPEINMSGTIAYSIHQEWHTTWTGESVFLRSSYETDYANWLDENQISYSVEELRIEYYDSQQDKTRVAIPDFYLTSTNEIVEIKSDYTLDIQEMLDKFEAYKNSGYIPKLVLEGKEVDIYKIEEEVDEKRLEKIKNKNISAFK